MGNEPMQVDVDAPRTASSSSSSSTTATTVAPGKRSESNLPWVEKYRPADLEDVISHHSVVGTLTQLISKGRLPHLLFYGPPGTGKTSTVLAIARQLNGPNYGSMILELNASDDRGIDVVREQIKNFASSRMLFSSGLKLIILDEADNMTKQAQFALRRIIEKYTKSTRFCLICNYVNKIIPALQSRCTRFRFGPLQDEDIERRLRAVCETERVQVSDDGLQAIIKLAGGDMRKCLNVLQSCHLSFPERVDETAVYTCTGQPLPSDIESILQVAFNQPPRTAFDHIVRLQVERGLSLVDIVTYTHELLLRIALPPHVLAFLLDKLSDLEYRLSSGASERIQLAGFVGLFQSAKSMALKTAVNATASSAVSSAVTAV